MLPEITALLVVAIVAVIAAIVTEVRYSQRKKEDQKTKEQREPIRVIDFNQHCDCKHCKHSNKEE